MIDHGSQIFTETVELLAFSNITQNPLDRVIFIELYTTCMDFNGCAGFILTPQGRFIRTCTVLTQSFKICTGAIPMDFMQLVNRQGTQLVTGVSAKQNCLTIGFKN